MRSSRSLLSALLFVVLVTLPLATRAQDATPMAEDEGTPATTGSLTVVASGLTNPRGFGWGPDDRPYLALAGHGGDTHIPVRPGFTIDSGLSSSVVRVWNGCATPVVQGLVSTLWEEPGWVWGAMDVAFIDPEFYVLISGAGPSWASPSSRSGIFRITFQRTMELVADLSSWLPDHPPQAAPPEGPSPDGSLFDLEATSDALLLSDSVNGLIIKVTPAGEISTFADLSDKHPLPTGIAVDAEGNVYVGFESAMPYTDGSVTIVKIAPDGTISDAWTGLTRVADVVLSPDGTLYAAELSTGNTVAAPYTYPYTGRIVRQTGPDTAEVVADGLNYPVGLGFGWDDALYVTGPANGANNGEGWLALVEMGRSTGMAPVTDTCRTIATPTT